MALTTSCKPPISILAASLFAISCGETPTTAHGDLVAHWDVLPAGCESAEVETIQFDLSGPSERRSLFACSAGEATLDRIVSGTYMVKLTGLSADGTPTFTSEPEEVLVHPDIDSSMRVGLTSAPGTIRATWAFENGRLCGTNEIDEVNIRVFDMFDYLIAEEQAPCSEANIDLSELKAGTYLVHAQGVTEQELSFVGTSKVTVERGESSRVDIVLREE